MSEHPHSLKMRQSLAQLERSFHHEARQDEVRRVHMQRQVAARSAARSRARARQKSSMRFYMLTLSLVLTAVLVTIGMLALLYVLLV